MQVTDYYYDIIYRFKGQNDKKEIIGLNEELLDFYLKQLKNGALSLKGEIILNFQDLNYFKIIKKNYKYYKEGMYFTEEPLNNDKFGRKTDDLPTLGNLLIEINDDVTNQLLFYYGITGEDYSKKGKIILKYYQNEDSILYVNSHEIKLEKGSKGLEFFRLIFLAKELYQNNKFTYIKLKKAYEVCGIKFEKLKSYELSQVEINNFLGKKLKTIQDKTNMKEKCLNITSAFVCIRQEMANNN